MGLFNFFRKKKQNDKTVSDFEFDENAQQKAIRLIYARFEKFNRYGTNEVLLGKTYNISSPFLLPEKMTLNEACQVVSYLTNKIEQEEKVEEASEESVVRVGEILNNFGFKKLDGYESGHKHAVQTYKPGRLETTLCDKVENVVDLFTINGHSKEFKRSDLHERYFDWYSPNVSEKDFNQIYDNISAKTKKEYRDGKVINAKKIYVATFLYYDTQKFKTEGTSIQIPTKNIEELIIPKGCFGVQIDAKYVVTVAKNGETAEKEFDYSEDSSRYFVKSECDKIKEKINLDFPSLYSGRVLCEDEIKPNGRVCLQGEILNEKERNK